jgi:hypothetical protein
MSGNHRLKALHAERLKRHIGDGAVAAATSGARTPSSPSSTPTLKPEGNKRKVEVIDLIDDDDKKESRQKKKETRTRGGGLSLCSSSLLPPRKTLKPPN